MSNLQTYQAGIGINRKYASENVGDATGLAGKRFHFIGAGGVGMSGLAKVLLKHKAIVTGSDQTETSIVTDLCQIGANIEIGHKAENLGPSIDEVVISAAIKEDNPELMQARKNGLKIYKYAEMLGILASYYDGIAIAGTHGKSTTAGWLVYCLNHAGCNPSFIVGAEISQLGSSSGVGEGKFFVAEACEYDRSFLNLRPKIACILNIEQDHLDYYKDEDEIVETFGQFARVVRPDGILITNGEDGNVAKATSRLTSNMRRETFGLEGDFSFSAHNIKLTNCVHVFDVYHNRKFLGSTRISLPGIHNVQNALAVLAIATTAGLEPRQILELLPNYTGVERRLMLKDQIGQITVLDDYAHHPTEIRASLKALRQRYQPRRIWCIFQPHQYSRTRFLLDDFAKSFNLADVTIVPEIYFVRDSVSAKKKVNSGVLVERIRCNGAEAVFINNFSDICDYLKKNVSVGDLVVTMGAGDIWKVADEYIQWLRENR